MFIKACILDDHPCTDTRNHTAMSFVNSDWPYIPLLEGSHRALLPVGLHYKLLALGLSLSFRFCAVVNIEVCFRWLYYSVGSTTVRKAWVSGESSPVIKDSNPPSLVLKAGAPIYAYSSPSVMVLPYTSYNMLFSCCCVPMDYFCNLLYLLYGLFYISHNFYTACTVCCTHFTTFVHQLACFASPK
jgi:hypothetical protein